MFGRRLKNAGFLTMGAVAVFSIILSLFVSCNSPMGLGPPVDFEPPVLTLDRIPNPWYVNTGAVLKGTVTDNIAVARVICRDTTNPNNVYGEASIFGNRFQIVLNFNFCNNCSRNVGECLSPGMTCDNNRKISVEVVAWDRAGNSGEESVQFVNLIVDRRPPIFTSPSIRRSPTRTAPLREYNDLTAMNYRRVQHVEFFQNGSFWLTAEVNELETYPRTVELKLFDHARDSAGQEIYSAEFDSGTSFSPQWLIKEKVIEQAGNAAGLNYTNRLENGESIYLRVSMVAIDLAGNVGESKREDFGWLCINRRADIPRSLTAGGIGQYISPGTEIPIDVFDDDLLDEVYVDLLRIEKYN